MSSRTRILVALVLGTAAGAFTACQTYDFEPVEPLALTKETQAKKVVARNAKPNIMLLVDRSGSMHDPLDRNQMVGGVAVCNQPSPAPPCGQGFPNCDSRCVTRWRAMEKAMGGFLGNATSGAIARFGLGYFPNADPNNSNSSCNPGSVVGNLTISQSNDVDAELATHAAAINANISGLPETQVFGGTPTAVSLAIAGNTRELTSPDREDFILLLTDGLPNCNQKFVTSPALCKACVNSASPTQSPPCGNGLNCLDDDDTVNIINNLKSRGIRVIVVGFGSDTAGGPAFAPLNRMAEAGGMARNCLDATGNRNPALCGTGETCDSTPAALCSTRFYKAADSAELTAALQKISLLVGSDVCEFTLDSAPDPKLMSVDVNGANIPQAPDTWTVAGNKLTFTDPGRICPQIKAATPQNPVNVEISAVTAL